MAPHPVHAQTLTFSKLDKEEIKHPSHDGVGEVRPVTDVQPTDNQPTPENKRPVPETSKVGQRRNSSTTKPKASRLTEPSSTSRLYSKEANGDIQVSMKAKVVAKWGEEYWPAMHYILDHESGSNPHAVNKKSGACGIPQALPCNKLLKVVGSLDNVEGQLDWIVNYVANRYGDPVKAQAFHEVHNWY